jgi:hypothetical protein
MALNDRLDVIQISTTGCSIHNGSALSVCHPYIFIAKSELTSLHRLQTHLAMLFTSLCVHATHVNSCSVFGRIFADNKVNKGRGGRILKALSSSLWMMMTIIEALFHSYNVYFYLTVNT